MVIQLGKGITLMKNRSSDSYPVYIYFYFIPLGYKEESWLKAKKDKAHWNYIQIQVLTVEAYLIIILVHFFFHLTNSFPASFPGF